MDLTTVGGLRIGRNIIIRDGGGPQLYKKCTYKLFVMYFLGLIVSIVCQTISCITHTKALLYIVYYINTTVVISHNMFYTILYLVSMSNSYSI